MRVCIYIHIYIYIYISICVCAYIYICIYAYIHVQICIPNKESQARQHSNTMLTAMAKRIAQLQEMKSSQQNRMLPGWPQGHPVHYVLQLRHVFWRSWTQLHNVSGNHGCKKPCREGFHVVKPGRWPHEATQQLSQ